MFVLNVFLKSLKFMHAIVMVYTIQGKIIVRKVGYVQDIVELHKIYVRKPVTHFILWTSNKILLLCIISSISTITYGRNKL